MTGIINCRTAKPPKGYTDSQWNEDFLKIKSIVKPSKDKKIKNSTGTVSYSETYHGNTQYEYFRDFINNVLSNIRNGEKDYCFYIYQVAELLKYEYDNLKVDWLPNERCFEVYLIK